MKKLFIAFAIVVSGLSFAGQNVKHSVVLKDGFKISYTFVPKGWCHITVYGQDWMGNTVIVKEWSGETATYGQCLSIGLGMLNN